MAQPQVIFLDAVGTLFGIRGSVGAIYSSFAQQAGVQVNVTALERAFVESFRAAPRAAFPGVSAAELPAQEFAWWRAVAAESFARIGVLDQFADFDQFFPELFAHFATAAPWCVYAEVPQVLATWRSQGIELGVISNFDSRLYPVLAALDLAQFFTSVTLSTGVGAAKPDPAIFYQALAKHNCPAHAAWHIGDSFQEDYQGATAAGLMGVWLDRQLAATQTGSSGAIAAIASLTALLPPQ